MTSGKIKKEKLSAMTTLRRQWAIAWGGITAAVAIDPFFDGFWTAVTCLVIGIALDRGSSHRRRKINPCVRLMSLAGTALICSAVIMTMITAAERLNLLGDTFNEGHNSAIPYIASLVIYPTAAVIFGIAYLRHGHARYCASCPINRCDVSCSMLTGGLVHRQTRYQMMISMVIAGVIAMVTWIYYAVGYVNINFNRRHRIFCCGSRRIFRHLGDVIQCTLPDDQFAHHHDRHVRRGCFRRAVQAQVLDYPRRQTVAEKHRARQ
jgi:hypothetical protein